MQEDININGIYLGASSDANSDPFSQTMITNNYILLQSLTPEFVGKKIDVKFFDVVRKMRAKKKAMARQPPFFEDNRGMGYGQQFIDLYNTPDFAKAEIPSSNFR